MNEEQKKAFLAMPLEEQLLAIIASLSYVQSKIDSLEKRQFDFEDDIRLYRRTREVADVDAKQIANEVVKAIHNVT